MVMRVKERKIVVQSSEVLWKKIMKVAKAFDEGKKVEPVIETSFQSVEDLRKTLTAKRLELLHCIKHQQPKSIYQLAKMVKRDFKNVQKDVKLLENLGLIEFVKEKNKERVIVPYDRLQVIVPI